MSSSDHERLGGPAPRLPAALPLLALAALAAGACDRPGGSRDATARSTPAERAAPSPEPGPKPTEAPAPGREHPPAQEPPASSAGVQALPPAAPPTLAAPGPPPPPPPRNVSAHLASPTSARLRWSAATDGMPVAGYELLLGGEVVATARARGAVVAGLGPGRRHCFSVRAIGQAGSRSAPSEPACVVAPDVTPPSMPARLVAEGRPGGVALSWSPATDDVAVAGYAVLRDGAPIATVSATRRIDTAVTAASRRCYTVVALDAAGNRSAPAGPACASPPDVTPPSAPAGVSASSSEETAIALRWSPSTDDVGVVEYQVLDAGRVVARTVATGIAVAVSRPAVEVCRAVRACDAAGNCSAPSPPACATPPDRTPPTRVEDLHAVAASDRRVDLRWSPSHDAVGVARHAVRRGGETVLVVGGDVTRAEDAELSPGKRYCYSVVAEDAAGNASVPSDTACAVTPDLTPPTVPPRVQARPRSATRIALAWGASQDDVGVVGYEVLRGDLVLRTTRGLQASVEGLAAEREHCFSLRALDAHGNRSAPSPPVCVTTASRGGPTAPWDLRVTAPAEGELVLSWDPSPEPGVVYAVYWDGKGNVDRRIGTTSATAFRVFGRPARERHCYHVTAVDADARESPATFPACGRAGAPRSPPRLEASTRAP